MSVASAESGPAPDYSACEHSYMLETGRLSLQGDEKRQFKALLKILADHYPEPELSARIIAAFPECWEKFSAQRTEYNLIKAEYDPALAQLTLTGPGFAHKMKTPGIGALASRVSRLVKQAERSSPTISMGEALWFLWTEASIAATGERHNHYIYANELPWEKTISEGRSFAVGFKPKFENDTLYVREIVDEALQKQGLKPGHKISRITSRDFEAVDHFFWWTRQKPFSYQLHYHSENGVHTIDADSIPYFASSIFTSVWHNIAYIHIAFFSKRTEIELWRFLRGLGPDTESIIIDLRNNNGGVASPRVIDYFLKPSQIVLAFRENGRELERLNGTVAYVPHPVVLLLNHNSASMCELMAAALQQQKRALVVGERSYGKSVGQTAYPVGNEGAVMLVTTRYFYPNGADHWGGNGILPDYKVTVSTEQEKKITEALLSGDINVPELMKTDPQLAKAIELAGDYR
jgi:carboxyl-terminal processing protease